MATKDKDYRLVTLIVDVCPLPCRKLFLNLAQSDSNPGVPYSTLDNYMAFRQNDVMKLMKLPSKSIRTDQFDLIYPTADIEKWDVSLLSSLLFGLFRSRMLKGEDQLIKNIREIRNKLQHKPGSVVMEDTEFDTTWDEIEANTLTLAQLVDGQVYENEITKLIEDARTKNLPRLGDTLKLWYEDIIIQLRSDLEALTVTSQKSLGILEATTVKHKTSAGGNSKKLKIDDPILKKLRGQLKQTIEREVPDGFSSSPEDVSNIRSKLRENHFVVVSGYENTSYLATALSAITESDYILARCVEMENPDDWRHVDPEETDLVLFRDPLHENLAMISPVEKKKMADTFRRMVQSATMPHKESRIDVVIVSEHKMIEDWKEQDDNKLFEDIVVLYKPTEETDPLDLVKRHTCTSSSKRRSTDDVLRNMLAYSEAYIQQWRTVTTDQKLLESAKKKFQRHKAIVITGPKGSGKTNFAVNLVSSCYEKNQCVVLTEASEWKHVILGEVSVIIIDEFAGKFKYNAALADGWLSKFDFIYAAVTQGKLNVIVTCETTKFSKLLKSFSGHALLNNRIKLTARGLGNIVKSEPVSPTSEQNSSDTGEHDKLSETINAVATLSSEPAVSEQKAAPLFECGQVQTIKDRYTFIDFCEMPDGTLIVCLSYAEQSKRYSIAKFDLQNYKAEQSVDLPCEPNAVSFIDEQEVVIFMREKKQMQHAGIGDSNIELREIKDIPINHDWLKLVRIKGGKYVMCTESCVFMYDLNWRKIHEISHCFDKSLFYDGWPSNESKASKRRHITDIAVGEDKFHISSEEKIVVLNFDGEVILTAKTEGKSVALYNEEFLLILSKSTISIISVEGSFVGMLIKGAICDGLPLQPTYNIFYGKKVETLFICGHQFLMTCPIKASR